LKIKPPAFLDRCRDWIYEDCKVLRIRATLQGDLGNFLMSNAIAPSERRSCS
jgi:hypothetical protein